jgi:hypothetical protein
LEYWKNERVVYGRRESSARLKIPAILDVITANNDTAGGTLIKKDVDPKKSLRQKGFQAKPCAAGTVFDVIHHKERHESNIYFLYLFFTYLIPTISPFFYERCDGQI